MFNCSDLNQSNCVANYQACTWVATSLFTDTHYYQAPDALKKKERLRLGILAGIKTLLSAGTALLNADTRSEWRQVFWGRREVIYYGSKAQLFDRPQRAQHVLKYLSHLKELDLMLNQLSSLPENLDNLSAVTSLTLNANHLTSLPESLGNLSRLEKLNLRENQLASLPENLGHLRLLRELDLSTNQLASLPETTGNLSLLRELDLSNNQLTSLPETMGNLSALTELFADYNQLTSLPETMGNLRNLTVLSANTNQLTLLPESLCKLSALTSLSVCNNQLTSLTDSFGNLCALNQLDLSGNQLSSVPDSFGDLTALNRLFLRYNQFTEVPECLFRLSRQCTIRFEGNRLSPETVTALNATINDPDYQGPRFELSIHDAASRVQVDAAQLPDLLAEWSSAGDVKKHLDQLSPSDRESLANFLARLKETAEFKHDASRPRFQARVKDLLAWLIKTSPETRMKAMVLIDDANATCGDRVSRCFNDLSILKKLDQSPHMPLRDLAELIIGIKRHELLLEIAKSKVNAPDPIEVVLKYEIALKDTLKLPIEVEKMLYESLSNVTGDEISAAKKSILDKTTSSSDRLNILIESPIWQERLKKEPRFAAVEAACKEAKAAWLKSVEGQDVSAVFAEFQKREKTLWNPYYQLTK